MLTPLEKKLLRRAWWRRWLVWLAFDLVWAALTLGTVAVAFLRGYEPPWWLIAGAALAWLAGYNWSLTRVGFFSWDDHHLGIFDPD